MTGGGVAPPPVVPMSLITLLAKPVFVAHVVHDDEGEKGVTGIVASLE
jgi:hypothetical protein